MCWSGHMCGIAMVELAMPRPTSSTALFPESTAPESERPGFIRTWL